MFEWVKEDLKKISSHQHKFYLIINIIYMVMLNIMTFGVGIMMLCFSVKDFWWISLLFFIGGIVINIISVYGIKSRLRYYRLALEREKSEQENKIKEDNYETKNSL
ncbi:MAG: hypothetical protein K2L42_04620 [Clostridia bacterium]|nr:hypothetical protein [Clostridia bacterium]